MKHAGFRAQTIMWTIGAALVGACALGDADVPETAAGPLSALWTGAAGNSDLTDFGNWDCFDAAGAKIPDALPTAATAVTLSGNLAIDIPAGAAFQYATLSFGACTVTADCDWCGLGLVRIGADGIMDLNGRTVAVGGLCDQGTLVNTAANLATVVLGRGDADATLGFTPPANVKVRKEGAGTLTVNGQLVDKLEIAQGGVVCKKPAFRHYRFVVLRPWGSTAVAVQFSEFRLLDGKTDVTPLRSGVSWLEYDSPESLTVPMAVDGDFGTKFFDRRASGGNAAANKGNVYIQLDYDEPQPITGYDWATANDRPNNYGSDERDPADWLLMGSDDGETWITLDRRMNYYATTVRKVWVGPFALASSMNVAGESAATSLTLDDGVNFSTARLRVGSINLAQGATLTIPQYKWFRFSVKQLEGASDMQLGEFALYDALGNRVNLGLTLGSSATALAPGTYVSSGYNTDYLFDGKDSSANVEKWWVGGNTPSPSNPNTWNVLTMRLADDVASVASYNLATANDSSSQYKRNPKAWQIEVSMDGVNWLVVDERVIDQGPHANKTWYNGGVPYKVLEPGAAVVTGAGEVVKKGGGEATFQGSFAGDVGLRVEAGRFTVVPELSRCKWFRFSVKQLEGGDKMQVSELALYDASGNRVNQGLPRGTSAAELSPGTYFASGEVATGDCLFDGSLGPSLKWWCGGNTPSPLNPSTWNVVTMRLADDAATVASYNLATANDSATYPERNPKTWMFEASADGVNWLVVDERALSQGPHANQTWYNNGVPYKVSGGIVAAPEAESLGRVSVAAGAELNLPSAVPVKGLEIDASGAGSINKLELAPGGVIDIVNAAEDEFTVADVNYRVPLTIGALSGAAGSWHVRINGVDRNGLKLRAVDNALYIRPNVFMVIIR